MRFGFFLTYMFASKNDKPYPATFDQFSSKSDEPFSSYNTWSLLIQLNPLNPITYKDQFSSHLIHLTILGIVSIHTEAQKPLVFLILLFSRGLSGLSWDLDFSWHTGLLQKMTNHIPQLLAKFHQNLMKRFQIMPKKPHFLH